LNEASDYSPALENADAEDEGEEQLVLLEERPADVAVDAGGEMSVEDVASFRQVVALPARHYRLYTRHGGTGSHFVTQRPSDPVTRESSDPETQLTRRPCSIMNSKCRLTLQTNAFAMGKRFASLYRCLAFARFWKGKILKITY